MESEQNKQTDDQRPADEKSPQPVTQDVRPGNPAAPIDQQVVRDAKTSRRSWIRMVRGYFQKYNVPWVAVFPIQATYNKEIDHKNYNGLEGVQVLVHGQTDDNCRLVTYWQSEHAFAVNQKFQDDLELDDPVWWGYLRNSRSKLSEKSWIERNFTLSVIGAVAATIVSLMAIGGSLYGVYRWAQTNFYTPNVQISADKTVHDVLVDDNFKVKFQVHNVDNFSAKKIEFPSRSIEPTETPNLFQRLTITDISSNRPFRLGQPFQFQADGVSVTQVVPHSIANLDINETKEVEIKGTAVKPGVYRIVEDVHVNPQLQSSQQQTATRIIRAWPKLALGVYPVQETHSKKLDYYYVNCLMMVGQAVPEDVLGVQFVLENADGITFTSVANFPGAFDQEPAASKADDFAIIDWQSKVSLAKFSQHQFTVTMKSDQAYSPDEWWKIIQNIEVCFKY